MTSNDIATDPHAVALVMALATALDTKKVLPADGFIAAIRTSALQMKGIGTPGMDELADQLLATATVLALRFQRQSE